MAHNIFDLFNSAFQLMSENKLKRDIDDTLLEKLLTLIENYILKSSSSNEENYTITERKSIEQPDFTKEFLNKTKAMNLIEKVLFSFADGRDTYPTLIKAFVLRLLGLIYMSQGNFYSYNNLLPLFCHDQSVTGYDPSFQNALLYCLSCITKNLDGARFFIKNNLKDFVFANFYSNSYYVRKTAVNFIANFISIWRISRISGSEKFQEEESDLEEFVTDILGHLFDHIHIHETPKERLFAEGCIAVFQKLLEHPSSEGFIGNPLSLAERISKCFMNLTEDVEFNKKLADLFLTIDSKFVLPDVKNDAIKCLILQEEIELAMDLASSFTSKEIPTHGYEEEINFFLLPFHILMSEKSASQQRFFTLESDLVCDIVSKKMEGKSSCKAVVTASLNALQKTVPVLDSRTLRAVGSELLKVVKDSDQLQHKWIFAVLEDRMVHHSFAGFYTSMKSENVYVHMVFEESDLVFQSILEYLKKPTTDSFFIAQLLLLMKDVLILQEKYKFKITDTERDDLIQRLSRGLHDKRESVVDSAIHLAGQMMMSTTWQTKVCDRNILSTLWDFAIYGNLDGAIRSTALKVIVNGCLESWCMDEMKKLKGINEEDIIKILFDLTNDPDFFLQREALSCLYEWMKLKWDHFKPVSKDYLFSALVVAVRSLDLELKLLSLDIWLWLLENQLTFANLSPTQEIEEYVEKLTFSGFGLSLLHAIDDCDEAVQFKAAKILEKLKTALISKGYTLNSLPTNSFSSDRTCNNHISDYLTKTYTKEEKEKGIDSVMEISTTDQLSSICNQNLSEIYNFKQEYFLKDSKDRKCSLPSFWTCLWSETVVEISKSLEKNNCDINAESLLKDIISARMQEYGSIEDTPDCY